MRGIQHKVGSARERGFTLIELLVVVIIVGVLAAIAIPVYLNQRKKANTAALKQDLRTVAASVETWFVDNPRGRLYAPDADHSGWSVIVRGTPDAAFMGTFGSTTAANVFHSGFPVTKVSPGNAVGVLATGNIGGAGAYCLVGNAKGSDYEVPPALVPGVSRWNFALYYDSLAGGIYTPRTLPDGGACDGYHDFIAALPMP